MLVSEFELDFHGEQGGAPRFTVALRAAAARAGLELVP